MSAPSPRRSGTTGWASGAYPEAARRRRRIWPGAASAAPYGVEDLDYFAGMGALNAEGTKLFLNDPEAARSRHRQDWEETVAATPEQLAEGIERVLSPVDAEALPGDLAQWLASSDRDGPARGCATRFPVPA